MLDTTEIHREVLSLLPIIRRTIAKTLRSSRYYTDDHVEECMGDIVVQIFDYAVGKFDPSKGSAKSHFTTFAKQRALNWLALAHRSRETVAPSIDSDDGSPMPVQFVSDEPNAFAQLQRSREAAQIREAFATLEPREQELIEAFSRTHNWGDAAQEIGVSPATASRMRAVIVAKLG